MSSCCQTLFQGFDPAKSRKCKIRACTTIFVEDYCFKNEVFLQNKTTAFGNSGGWQPFGSQFPDASYHLHNVNDYFICICLCRIYLVLDIESFFFFFFLVFIIFSNVI